MSLSSDEHVIYSTRFSKRLFVKPFMVSVIALVAAGNGRRNTVTFGLIDALSEGRTWARAG